MRGEPWAVSSPALGPKPNCRYRCCACTMFQMTHTHTQTHRQYISVCKVEPFSEIYSIIMISGCAFFNASMFWKRKFFWWFPCLITKSRLSLFQRKSQELNCHVSKVTYIPLSFCTFRPIPNV